VRSLVFLVGICLSTSVSADERTEAVARCISAFASGDQAAYDALVVEVRGWGTISDAKLSQAASACLALSSTSTPPSTDGAQEASAPTVEAKVDALDSYLKKFDDDPTAIGSIAEELANNSGFIPSSDERSKRLEDAILDYVRPLPSSKAEENLLAYKALLRLVPENASYAQKVDGYTNAIEAQALADKERQAGNRQEAH
jgi:hypothetical protein